MNADGWSPPACEGQPDGWRPIANVLRKIIAWIFCQTLPSSDPESPWLRWMLQQWIGVSILDDTSLGGIEDPTWHQSKMLRSWV